ncbi:eukaryotic translation initiation factor 2 subunit beta [Tanacetum coccineum]
MVNTRQGGDQPNIAAIIAEQLQNIIPQIVTQVTANVNNAQNANGGGGGGGQANNGCSYKTFQACGPKEYDGKGGAVALNRWIEKMETVIDNSGCLENQKVKYAASSFVNKALTWWNGQIQVRGRDAANGMSWNDFKALLVEEFCPSNEMEKLEILLLVLDEFFSRKDCLVDPTKKKKKKDVIQGNGADDHASDNIDNLSLGMEWKMHLLVMLTRMKKMQRAHDQNFHGKEVIEIINIGSPELAGDRRRTVIRPPQVIREGTKKSVFINFMDLCPTMRRQPDHVMTFLLAEIGINGSLDGQQRLVVKDRFATKNFEGILRRYINEYVIRNGCRSQDTILSKENHLFFLRCEQVFT